MIGWLFCRLWAHRFQYVFTNGANRMVVLCTRCGQIRVDRPGSHRVKKVKNP